MKMGVDIETYSSVDLQKAGVRPYTEAPDFTILLIGYRVDGQPTRIIDLADSEDADPTLLPPVCSDLPAGDLDEFLCLLTSPEVVKTAYNASFERTCLARYFARPMPPEQWRCTMVQAATLGLPGTLAQVGAALGLEKQKLTEGAELIRYFCKPTKDGTRHHSKDAPDKWERFRKYNVREWTWRPTSGTAWPAGPGPRRSLPPGSWISASMTGVCAWTPGCWTRLWSWTVNTLPG